MLSNQILSNSMTVICAIVLVTLAVNIIIGIALPKLSKKLDIGKTIDTTQELIESTKPIVEVTESILPNNPVVNTIKVIEKWATIGVNYAEQLYNTSKLNKEERNPAAKEQVYTVLKLLNIEVTSEVEKIVDGAIEAEVLALKS